MKKTLGILILFSLYIGHCDKLSGQNKSDTLMYHAIQTDKDGLIIPWYSPDPGDSYDHILGLVWNYWKNLPECLPGIKWYLLHRQIIVSTYNSIPKGGHDDGIGGDQIAMALSSWTLYYAYTGDHALIKDMVYMADYYLQNGLSTPDCKWPDVPYPCNPGLGHNLKYSGDWVVDFALYKKKEDKLARKEAMKNGDGYLMPDKAGSFAYELVNLYKITGDVKYLDAAVKIANTLAKYTVPGDKENSPLPYRVQPKTGEIFPQTNYVSSTFTSNWTATIMLFDELTTLKKGNMVEYIKARNLFVDWLKNIAVKYDLYGPFFEDVPMWSNTQINALSIAMYILQKKDEWGLTWREDARRILDWSTKTFRHDNWKKYGVVAIGEQTVYNAPGNSHTARQASAELMYCAATGDNTNKDSSILQLNWATYMVDTDGKNCYPNNEIWLTDGYGDYVRHYLRAMASFPELAPSDKNRFLSSSSVVKSISYDPDGILYSTYGTSSDILRLKSKPGKVICDGKKLKELKADSNEGFSWQPLTSGGVLKINHKGNNVSVKL